jgi:hypothetical protein
VSCLSLFTREWLLSLEGRARALCVCDWMKSERLCVCVCVCVCEERVRGRALAAS